MQILEETSSVILEDLAEVNDIFGDRVVIQMVTERPRQSPAFPTSYDANVDWIG